MTKFLQKLTSEPVLVVGVITAAFGVLVVFGIELSKEQIGAIVTLAGAVMALVRFLVTPSKMVVARTNGSKDSIVAGKASTIQTGKHVLVIPAADQGSQ